MMTEQCDAVGGRTVFGGRRMSAVIGEGQHYYVSVVKGRALA